ncbi:MAG: ABC transporter ATP-binding protein [Phycisphaerae bacterium]|nr:ABC transporter ATP-binding protein [Phycisphaerae bacterium]
MSKHANVILEARDIHKSYWLGQIEVPVLKGVDLEVVEGEFLAVVGASGSGKSTLLHVLGALDTLDQGQVTFEGVDVFAADESYRNQLRNRRFGFVFQFYHLLPELTVLENVLMPELVGSSVVAWLSKADRSEETGMALLEQFGLAHRAHHLPSQLSGGERQRAAIVRAVMNQPVVLFADEPTGNLDATTGRQIIQVLMNLHRGGQTIVMVTHDQEIARTADRTIRLTDGRTRREG